MTDKCTKEEPAPATTELTADNIASVQTGGSTYSRVPLKKRGRTKKHTTTKHRLLKHQGSSSLGPKHRQLKKFGQNQRVEFAIFLKILLRQLLLSDKELHAEAQEMVRECIKTQR
eukprot:767361_1